MKNTAIEWTDHTINFWWGCTKVSPACEHCYAEKFAAYAGRRVFGEPVQWGKGQPRRERLAKARAEALALNRQAEKKGVRYKVFANSMSDWLDDEVPAEWLARLIETIHDTPQLDWQLLTKRPGLWPERMRAAWPHIPAGTPFMRWFNAWCCPVLAKAAATRDDAPPPNVWIGTTVEDQTRADERIPHLLRIPARVRFLSCEPLLGPVNLNEHQPFLHAASEGPMKYRGLLAGQIHWVICGGESGGQARPMHPFWLRSLRNQCQNAGVPFFFKQWGEWLPQGETTPESLPANAKLKGHRFEDDTLMLRVGTARSGAFLDGQPWQQFPAIP